MLDRSIIANRGVTTSWDALSDLAKTSISHGLTADQMERMANLMLQTAAEMRRAGLGREMARA